MRFPEGVPDPGRRIGDPTVPSAAPITTRWTWRGFSGSEVFPFAVCRGDEIVALAKRREIAETICQQHLESSRLASDASRLRVTVYRLQAQVVLVGRTTKRLCDALRGSARSEIAVALGDALKLLRQLGWERRIH